MSNAPGISYVHVNVFSQIPYGGNSLPVFLDARGLRTEQMLRITQELRHFEAVFLEPTAATNVWRTRVFDLFEELPFAGHPIIGAAAALHRVSGHADAQTWRFALSEREVSVVTERTSCGYFGWLDQGPAKVIEAAVDSQAIAHAFGLEQSDLEADLPLEVISTGLRYLIIPVKPGCLQRAGIVMDIAEMLEGMRAQFAVLLDEASLEIRHWNNDGVMEDVATGSAAGTIGAYRLRHGLAESGAKVVLNQGRFTGRPSTLHVHAEGTAGDVRTVKVGGDVTVIGRGVLEALP